MNLHFNDHLKKQFKAMLEDLSLEEIAEGLVNNTINYRKFRNKAIKKEFDSIFGDPNLFKDFGGFDSKTQEQD